MTSTAMRDRVHKYVDEVDIKFLKAVYQLLEIYHQNNSLLTANEQKVEIEKRSKLYKEGKIKSYTLAEARKRIKQKLR